MPKILGEDSFVTETAAPPVMPPAAPVSDGNEEFPVPFERFATSLRFTPDEVYLSLMQVNHGRENHKPSEWRGILDSYRSQPAHPDHPGFDPSVHA